MQHFGGLCNTLFYGMLECAYAALACTLHGHEVNHDVNDSILLIFFFGNIGRSRYFSIRSYSRCIRYCAWRIMHMLAGILLGCYIIDRLMPSAGGSVNTSPVNV